MAGKGPRYGGPPIGVQRIRWARSAYVEFVSTPDIMRPPGCRTIEEFCRLFQVDEFQLARFAGDAEFEREVLASRTHWVKRLPRVFDSVFRNAEDRSREDQWLWVVRAMRIAGISLAHEKSKLSGALKGRKTVELPDP